jgi:hypothetical protein
MGGYMGKRKSISERLLGPRMVLVLKYLFIVILGLTTYAHLNYAAGAQVLSDLDQVKAVLSQLGPAFSAMLFIIAGIFYAVGQMLPPDKKAHFQSASINIIIGAIVVGALSFASTSLALSSTHILTNFTAVNTVT